MKITKQAVAGTLESSDIMITLEPGIAAGITIELTSPVYKQFGKRIEEVIKETLLKSGIDNAFVSAVDKGALDCTIRARTKAAIFKATA